MLNKLHGYLATAGGYGDISLGKENSTLDLQMFLLPTSSSLARDTLLNVVTNER